MFGGNFNSLMPSSLFRKGAYATNSKITNDGVKITNPNRQSINKIYKDNGCHHCGKMNYNC